MPGIAVTILETAIAALFGNTLSVNVACTASTRPIDFFDLCKYVYSLLGSNFLSMIIFSLKSDRKLPVMFMNNRPSRGAKSLPVRT
ncbi:hypothetical protein DERP_005867 [Dermatophagoides pteronyssinus]|uniref:Uncharacterized protein n=1 Tax=Dermatophagoides pteronyssinus TaxID=6956 RepID=A0ABQ8J9T1_DERPT|nr:hypothetical protein DERP_005867 [Dermatophagoides pteronyssinus]